MPSALHPRIHPCSNGCVGVRCRHCEFSDVGRARVAQLGAHPPPPGRNHTNTGQHYWAHRRSHLHQQQRILAFLLSRFVPSLALFIRPPFFLWIFHSATFHLWIFHSATFYSVNFSFGHLFLLWLSFGHLFLMWVSFGHCREWLSFLSSLCTTRLCPICLSDSFLHSSKSHLMAERMPNNFTYTLQILLCPHYL